MDRVTAQFIISIAEKHAGGNGSARLALEDAKALQQQGRHEYAANRALTSLKHSIGILHASYKASRVILQLS